MLNISTVKELSAESKPPPQGFRGPALGHSLRRHGCHRVPGPPPQGHPFRSPRPMTSPPRPPAPLLSCQESGLFRPTWGSARWPWQGPPGRAPFPRAITATPPSGSLARNRRSLQPATSQAAAHQVPGAHSTQPSPHPALLPAPWLCPNRPSREAFPRHTETCTVPSSGPRCPHARLCPCGPHVQAVASPQLGSPVGQDEGLHHRATGP